MLWSEQHQPTCAAELAVHKKKVQEVEEWLKWAVDTARRASKGVRESKLLATHLCTDVTIYDVLPQAMVHYT